MKYLFLSFACLVVFLLASNKADAILTRGFGGHVVSSYTPGVVCGGVGPLSIVPSIITIPAFPYYFTPTSLFFDTGRIPVASQTILGSYPTFPVPGICYTTTPVPVPVPVFTILRYGLGSLP